MKEINVYLPEKYQAPGYARVCEHIYKTYDEFMGEDRYVTSLCFVQEPELGEGASPREISQYPLEDLLDRFYVSVSDHYEKENAESDRLCYLEFCGSALADVKSLLGIVGKHVWNQEQDGYIKLLIE